MKLTVKLVFEDDSADDAERSARLFFIMLSADRDFFKRLKKNGKAGVRLVRVERNEKDGKGARSASASAELTREEKK